MAGRKGRKKQKGKGRKKGRSLTVDPHSLYEAAVQNVEADADFIERIWKKELGGRPRRLREDFCGTASLAAHWASRHPDNYAWGVDLDSATLDWGRRHRLEPAGEAAERVTLICDDVRVSLEEAADVQAAFNFSYFVFKTREELGEYFASVYGSLGDQGMFFLDAYGGSESWCTLEEETKVDSRKDPDGRKVPAFTYIWEHASFNPIDNHLETYIHFRLKDGRTLRKAFRYDWRFWTLPELRELLAEAGFTESQVYVEGWDENDEPDGVFRRRKRFDNEGSWIGYVVARKG